MVVRTICYAVGVIACAERTQICKVFVETVLIGVVEFCRYRIVTCYFW